MKTCRKHMAGSCFACRQSFDSIPAVRGPSSVCLRFFKPPKFPKPYVAQTKSPPEASLEVPGPGSDFPQKLVKFPPQSRSNSGQILLKTGQLKGQNESRRELQNGSELGPSEGARILAPTPSLEQKINTRLQGKLKHGIYLKASQSELAEAGNAKRLQ